MLLIRAFNYLFTLRYISLFLFVDLLFSPPSSSSTFWLYIIAWPLSRSSSFRSLSLSLYSFAQNGYSSFAVAFARGYSNHICFFLILFWNWCDFAFAEYHFRCFSLVFCVSVSVNMGSVCLSLSLLWLQGTVTLGKLVFFKKNR